MITRSNIAIGMLLAAVWSMALVLVAVCCMYGGHWPRGMVGNDAAPDGLEDS